jgi:hypothetical protein
MERDYSTMSKEEIIVEFGKLKQIYEKRIEVLKNALSAVGPMSDDARRKEMMTQVILRDMKWVEALHKASGNTVVVEFGKGLQDERGIFLSAKQFVNEMMKQLPEKAGEEK